MSSGPRDAGQRWRWVTRSLLLALAVYVALGYDQHTLSNDEPVQHSYGQLLLDWYASGLTDTRAFHYVNLYLYGGFFDLLAAGLERLLPIPVWDLRHLLTGLAGLAGTWAAALTARRLGGERAAALTVLMLALTGAWSGAFFTHTKDVSFACAMTWALYFNTILVSGVAAPAWRAPRWPAVLGWALATGVALGLRVGGVFAVGYLGLSLLLVGFWHGGGWPALQRAWQSLWRPALVALTVVAGVTAVSWPWVFSGPTHLFDAATKFSQFTFALRTLLAGDYLWIADVPRSYLPHYLAVRLPELLLAGLLMGALLLVRRSIRFREHRSMSPGAADPGGAPAHLPLLLAAGFPLLLALATRPALYNGIRHFTFLLPPLAIAAALAWEQAWRAAAVSRQRLWRALLPLLLLVLAADAGLRWWQLHPYQYVAYNHLPGGTAAAQDRYELDYWSDGLREAAASMNSLVALQPPPPGGHYRVAVCAEPLQLMTYLDARFRGTRDWSKADFFVASTSENCDDVVKGPVTLRVSRAGATLVVVKDLRRR
jgi:hypothetical protein